MATIMPSARMENSEWERARVSWSERVRSRKSDLDDADEQLCWVARSIRLVCTALVFVLLWKLYCSLNWNIFQCANNNHIILRALRKLYSHIFTVFSLNSTHWTNQRLVASPKVCYRNIATVIKTITITLELIVLAEFIPEMYSHIPMSALNDDWTDS